MPELQTEPVREPDPLEIYSPENDAFLMKASLRKILTFVTTMTIAVVIVILRQSDPLFLFRFVSGSLADSQGILLIRFAMTLFYGYLVIFLVYFILKYVRRRSLSFELREKEYPAFRKSFGWLDLWTVVPVFLMVLVILTGFFYSPAVVDGASMEPTFSNGDPVLIEHFRGEYATGDVIIIQVDGELLIKRLIAVPGDHLVLDESGVYLNGTLIETFLPKRYDSGIGDFVPYFTYSGILPENTYFVLGDNRTNSTDSRVFGLVSAPDVLGLVVLPDR